jgi:hypothetical protein
MSVTTSVSAMFLSLCVLSGCSRTAAPGAEDPTSKTPSAMATEHPGSACDRNLVTAADAANALGEQVTATKNVPGDPQSCTFSTAGFHSLTIALRPGHGMAAVKMYTSGKMDEFEKSATLAGIGDEAVRSLGIDRVVSRKRDLLCEITGSSLANATDDSQARKLGAVCNKIFATY